MENQHYNQNNTEGTYDNQTTPPVIPTQQVNQPPNVPPMKPTTWLWQSIVVTLCCSPIFGIVGIINAVRVNSLYAEGRYEESHRASRRARLWTLIGLVFGIIANIVVAYMYTSGNLPSSLEQIFDNASGYNY